MRKILFLIVFLTFVFKDSLVFAEYNVEPYKSFNHWEEEGGWVTTREYKKSWGEEALNPHIEMIGIELDLNEQQKKEYLYYLYTVETQKTEEERKSYRIGRLQEIFGIPKYNLFIDWKDSQGLSIAPPRNRDEVEDYEEEVRWINEVLQEDQKPTGFWFEKTAFLENRLNELTKKLANELKLAEKDRLILKDILWNYRKEASKIEWDFRYIETAGELRILSKETVVERFKQRLEEIREVRREAKKKIKKLLNGKQEQIFEQLSGWDLDVK